MNLQEQREAWYLSKFRENSADFPQGAVRRGESPEPDFVVESDTGGTIGIEVTELYHDEASGSSSKLQESERLGLIHAACRQVEKAGVEPLDVAVYFAPDVAITKRDRSALAARLVALVSQHRPPSEGTVTLDNHFDGLIPDSMLGIRISRLAELTRHHWSAPMAEYLRPDFVEGLQARITAKVDRLKLYHRACGRCWLLVVVDGFGTSSLFDVGGSTLSHAYESPFERTFFLEAFSGRCFELHTPGGG